MDSDELGWTRMDSGGLGWTRMDSDGLGWTRMDSDGLGWTRIDLDRLSHSLWMNRNIVRYLHRGNNDIFISLYFFVCILTSRYSHSYSTTIIFGSYLQYYLILAFFFVFFERRHRKWKFSVLGDVSWLLHTFLIIYLYNTL